jgi:putative colanic acid biosynthesis acetyltransferase WcaF
MNPFNDQNSVDLSQYHDPLPLRNKLGRAVWNATWLLAFRPSPRKCVRWRRFLLRSFGARISHSANIYPSAKIWAPWNLEMKDFACLGPDVDCYCMAPIVIGEHAIVSQYAYLCSGSHDITDPHMKLISAQITLAIALGSAQRLSLGLVSLLGVERLLERARVFSRMLSHGLWLAVTLQSSLKSEYSIPLVKTTPYEPENTRYCCRSHQK